MLSLIDFLDFEDKIIKTILNYLSTFLVCVMLKLTVFQYMSSFRLIFYVLCGWLFCDFVCKCADYIAFEWLGLDSKISAIFNILQFIFISFLFIPFIGVFYLIHLIKR